MHKKLNKCLYVTLCAGWIWWIIGSCCPGYNSNDTSDVTLQGSELKDYWDSLSENN